MQQSNIDLRPKRIYRCDGRLQAGTSVQENAAPALRGDICNDFLNPCYILSGSGFYIDAAGRRCRYVPGSLLIRFPGVPHHQHHDRGFYADKYFALPAEYGRILLERKLITPEKPVIELGLRPALAGRFDELTGLLERESEERLILVMNEIFRFFCELLLDESGQNPLHGIIAAGAALLERDPEKRIPVEAVAAELGLSYARVRRLFTRTYKVPPAEYRIRRRIEKIQSLLTGSDLPLKEIADRFGYADVYTFARQFKQCTGITPGQFRKR